jgi:hypothetical protein
MRDILDVDRRSRGLHFQGLRDGSNDQRHAHVDGDVRGNLEFSFDRVESFCRERHAVVAGANIEDRVAALAVGGYHAGFLDERGLVASTFTPATTAPLGSVTAPEMVPCALRMLGTITSRPAQKRLVLKFLISMISWALLERVPQCELDDARRDGRCGDHAVGCSRSRVRRRVGELRMIRQVVKLRAELQIRVFVNAADGRLLENRGVEIDLSGPDKNVAAEASVSCTSARSIDRADYRNWANRGSVEIAIQPRLDTSLPYQVAISEPGADLCARVAGREDERAARIRDVDGKACLHRRQAG